MTAFNPKITHEIVKVINNTYKRNPWNYLYELAHSDRAEGYNEVWMTARLQQKWPGNYHVEPRKEPEGWITYHIVFDTPADETWFRLQYT